jgi:hypothetical protein
VKNVIESMPMKCRAELAYTAKQKETHKGILCILNQNVSVTLLDIDSECLSM